MNSPFCPLNFTLKERLSPAIFPSEMGCSPIVLPTVPVSLSASALRSKVISILPLGVSTLAFHLPVTSAAEAVMANSEANPIRHKKYFIRNSFGVPYHFPAFPDRGQRPRLDVRRLTLRRHKIKFGSRPQPAAPRARSTHQEVRNNETKPCRWCICFAERGAERLRRSRCVLRAVRSAAGAPLWHRRRRSRIGLRLD